MIRITIERTQYQTVDAPAQGDYEILGALQDWKPTTSHREHSRVLLLQEMDDHLVEVADVVALLNNLEPEPLCQCGHAAHVGDCSRGPQHSPCRCHRYETVAQHDHRLVTEKLREEVQAAVTRATTAETRLQGREAIIANQRRHVEKLSRSRDRLLSQRRKR